MDDAPPIRSVNSQGGPPRGAGWPNLRTVTSCCTIVSQHILAGNSLSATGSNWTPTPRPSLGVIRYGPSLLAGLVVCGRCGLRMAAAYNNNGAGFRYSCGRNAVEYGGARCQTLTGGPLDAFVSALVLQALEPAALEVSLQVAADVEAQRQRCISTGTSG